VIATVISRVAFTADDLRAAVVRLVRSTGGLMAGLSAYAFGIHGRKP
jgi:hypothetical protein